MASANLFASLHDARCQLVQPLLRILSADHDNAVSQRSQSSPLAVHREQPLEPLTALALSLASLCAQQAINRGLVILPRPYQTDSPPKGRLLP